MRVAEFGRVQLTIVACLLVVFHLTTVVATAKIEGEYLEARSVDVYTGACHFGSDYVEGGREATLIWQIESGTWNNVSLSGLTVVAVVSADQNLDLDQNARRSVLYLDPRATPAQQQVVMDLMQTKRSAVVGQVVAVKKVEINFSKTDLNYKLRVGQLLALNASRFPCYECTQPQQIWYHPLEEIDQPTLGKSELYRYQDEVLSVRWNRGLPSNNIFVGRFVM